MDWSKWEVDYTDEDRAELTGIVGEIAWGLKYRHGMGPDGVYVESVKVLCPRELKADWLCVIAAWNKDGRAIVGYVSGGTFMAALAKGLSRLDAGQIEWRKDKYRGKEAQTE